MANFKLGVVGLWHLGCVLCTAWSKLGNQVIGFDYDSALINNLKQAIPPLFEPDLAESIKRSIDEKHFHSLIKFNLFLTVISFSRLMTPRCLMMIQAIQVSWKRPSRILP